MDISVSIIIPVYNVERYLADCLNSVIKQTVSFDEIILVNDGSTDTSKEICNNYKLRFPEIKFLEQKNMGLSAARNAGLEVAGSDYIVFLDSDDMISSRMCEIIKSVLKNNNFLDVIYYAADIIKEIPIAFSEEGYSRNKEISGRVINGFDSLKNLFPEDYQMSACMAAYRRGFLEKNAICFIKGILYEDRIFSLQVISEAKDVIYITDKLYIRRFRTNSIITSPASRKKIEDIIYGHKIEWTYIRGHKKWQCNRALTQYYALCSSYMALQDDVGSLDEVDERKKYILAFWNFWNNYFDIVIMSLNELALLLYFLKKAKKNLIMFDSFSEFYDKIKDFLITKSKEKLNILPFKTSVRIGIYGIGQHTKCMLDLYRMLVGEIKSNLYFIVSQRIDKEDYEGKEIRQIEDLYQDTAYIVVSSKIYQKEICKKLEALSFDSNKIITLYNANDAVDFVIISRVLSNEN